MITITKAEALAIQAQHVDHYAAIYGEHVRALVASATTAHLLPDGAHDIVTINRHIPRGGAIEWLIPEKRQQEAEHAARRAAMSGEA